MHNDATNHGTLILLISLFGLVFETIGDYQKNIFYNNKAKTKKAQKLFSFKLGYEKYQDTPITLENHVFDMEWHLQCLQQF